MSRLFVAVIPPDEVLDEIEALDRPTEDGVRYTTRPQWHITLRFLGEADQRRVIDAFEAVEARPSEALLGPSVSRLGRHVLIVPVAGLEVMAAAVASATASVGEPPDPRPFTGHLTIARLRRRGACRAGGQAISTSFRVDGIHLVGSELHRDGARYERVATQELG